MRNQFRLPKSITPRDYQHKFVNDAIDLVTTDPDTWHLFRSPTGTGKSVAELLLLSCLPDSILITPRIEIIAGMMEKLGHYVEDLNDAALVEWSWNDYGIITPIRLRSLLAKGSVSYMPSCLIIDECHHDFASTYQDITMYLNGCPKVGLTATPYRGTPKGTQGYLEQWNNTVHTILTLPDAINKGYCSLPTPQVWPLLDDDLLDVSNGEFKLTGSTAEKGVDAAITDLVERCKPFYIKRAKLWDVPTMFSVSTTKAAKMLYEALIKANLPASIITQETSRKDRTKAFANVVSCSTALVQINVVSEGVDLPIRRLIDLSPTMSPVKWVQQIGRIMRPTKYCPQWPSCEIGCTNCELPPEYICCCRNLERHCYLMEGMLPNSTVKDAQDAWGEQEEGVPNFSKRSGTRVVGLEGLGRFKTVPIPLLDGTIGFMYNLVHTEGYKRTEYIAFVHPNHPDPIRGVKESAKEGEKMAWGKWKLTASLPDLKGCTTAKEYPLTEKQAARWHDSAEDFGLNPHVPINTRQFQFLPFLMNTGLRFRY